MWFSEDEWKDLSQRAAEAGLNPSQFVRSRLSLGNANSSDAMARQAYGPLPTIRVRCAQCVWYADVAPEAANATAEAHVNAVHPTIVPPGAAPHAKPVGIEVGTEVKSAEQPGRVRVTCDICPWGTLAIPEIAERELAMHIAKEHPVIGGPEPIGLPKPRTPRRRQMVDPTKETPKTPLAKQDPVLPRLDPNPPRPFRPVPKPQKRTR